MQDNSNQLTRQQQSSQADIAAAVERFGKGYMDFLWKYPALSKRKDMITTAHQAVEQGGLSLVEIDNKFSDGASEWWIKKMLIELFTFLGAFESVTVYQVNALAARIRQEYYHLTPAELTHFFYCFSLGDYGKLYAGRTVNPQDILIGLKDYSYILFEQRAMVDSEKLAEKQKQEAIEAKKNAITWEIYCERTGRDKTANPLGGIQGKAKNESKRADNGERK